MAIPDTYTETELATYLHGQLGPVASSLGWSVGAGSYEEIINDALLLYGVSDIASVTGRTSVLKLRMLGQLAAWRRVVAHTAGDCDFSADGGSFSRSQVNEQARQIVATLETDTQGYRHDAPSVQIRAVEYPQDPYGAATLMERAL